MLIILSRRQIEHDEISRINFHAITKYIYNAALCNLSGQPVQKLALLCIKPLNIRELLNVAIPLPNHKDSLTSIDDAARIIMSYRKNPLSNMWHLPMQTGR